MFKKSTIMFILPLGLSFLLSTVLADELKKPKPYIMSVSHIKNNAWPIRPTTRARIVSCKRSIMACKMRGSIIEGTLVDVESLPSDLGPPPGVIFLPPYSDYFSNEFHCVPGTFKELAIGSHIAIEHMLLCLYPYPSQSFIDFSPVINDVTTYMKAPIGTTTCTAIDDFKFLCRFP